VERALKEFNGIQSIGVSLTDQKVRIEYDESQVSVEEIKKAIENIGYDVK
jgi:copper chaperone CopZ